MRLKEQFWSNKLQQTEVLAIMVHKYELNHQQEGTRGIYLQVEYTKFTISLRKESVIVR
jgi:hypothetical protein